MMKSSRSRRSALTRLVGTVRTQMLVALSGFEPTRSVAPATQARPNDLCRHTARSATLVANHRTCYWRYSGAASEPRMIYMAESALSFALAIGLLASASTTALAADVPVAGPEAPIVVPPPVPVAPAETGPEGPISWNGFYL